MRRVALIMFCCAALPACVTNRPPPQLLQWEERQSDLQRASAWQLDGRAAAALGAQGWQATLNWRQAGRYAEVHLSGPFGIGALLLRQEPDGLSLNGAPPSDEVLSQLQERLGFAMPLDDLRFWLLGVPDPDSPFAMTRNAQDRALHLSQDGWSIAYDRYIKVVADVLPARLTLTRGDVRVRIVIDHWDWAQAPR
ncbi:MAG: lipoprotein insertase outer membrane protein LolB [Steroidobacteraceae bacterium]